MPKSLDVLGDSAGYIADMTSQIQAALNLLVFLKGRWGDHALFEPLRSHATKKDGLFERLLLAFQTAEGALETQIQDYTKREVENFEARVKSFKDS